MPAETLLNVTPDSDERDEKRTAAPDDITQPGRDAYIEDPPLDLRGWNPECDDDATQFFNPGKLNRLGELISRGEDPAWAAPLENFEETTNEFEARALAQAAAMTLQAEARAQAEAIGAANAVAIEAIAAAEAAIEDMSIAQSLPVARSLSLPHPPPSRTGSDFDFDGSLKTTPPWMGRSRELPPLVFGEVTAERSEFREDPTVNRDGRPIVPLMTHEPPPDLDDIHDDSDPYHLAEGTPNPERFLSQVPMTLMTIPAPGGRPVTAPDEQANRRRRPRASTGRLMDWLRGKK